MKLCWEVDHSVKFGKENGAPVRLQSNKSNKMLLMINVSFYLFSFFMYTVSFCFAALSEFWKESALVAQLRPHANIVQFFGVCLNPFCVVYEFLTNGDLHTYVTNKDTKIGNELLLKWFRGICGGMLHLTLEKIVHRDLAARNILLTPILEPKVSDFGMSRTVDDSGAHKTVSEGLLILYETQITHTKKIIIMTQLDH